MATRPRKLTPVKLAQGDDEYSRAVSHWVSQTVIGLGLCPWAKGAILSPDTRIISSSAATEDDLLKDLEIEMASLLALKHSANATTLVVCRPPLLQDFEEFNAMIGEVDDLVDDCGFSGLLQVASFHPDYRFAGEESITSYTNRSPYPVFHLLREKEVTVAIKNYAKDTSKIWQRNQEVMKSIGEKELSKLVADCIEKGKDSGTSKKGGAG